MSQKTSIEVPCPSCKAIVPTDYWHSINAQIDPQAKMKLLNGELNVFQCNNCNYKSSMPGEFLYHDMINKYCVQLIPFNHVDDNITLDRFTANGHLNINVGLPTGPISEFFNNIHTVFSMQELVRYIIFRDKLALRKAKIVRGPMVCCSCDRKVMEKESYYCVSRSIISKDGQDRRSCEVLAATAMFQICSVCMKKAATQRIEFNNTAAPLLNLEKEGAYQCAKALSAEVPMKWHFNPVDSDICKACEKPILTGDMYTSIEISEEVCTQNGVSLVGIHNLATLCSDCWIKYKAEL